MAHDFTTTRGTALAVEDLGRLAYGPALDRQRELHRRVLEGDAPPTVLLVEHDPVITLTHKKGVADHLVASPAQLEQAGVATHDTDRGGDITYHGPGQLVVYPILKLADFGLNLSRYMRLLEQAVIDTAGAFGVEAHREPGATGVWVARPEARGLRPENEPVDSVTADPSPQTAHLKPTDAKLCAMGVRIRRNTTLHGLALNVTTDLDHFKLIVPCGLHGRPVTSLKHLLGEACPTMDEVKRELVEKLCSHLDASRAGAT